MKIRRTNRMRDEAVQWKIVDALRTEMALHPMTRHEKRQLIKHRLAQAKDVNVSDIANGRNTALNCAVTRIYYLANPRGPKAAADLAEARRRRVGFLECYSIANGGRSLAEIEQSTSAAPKGGIDLTFVSPAELQRRLTEIISAAVSSCMFLEEIEHAFKHALATFPNGADLRAHHAESDE